MRLLSKLQTVPSTPGSDDTNNVIKVHGERIGPLAKLGRFKSTAYNFLVYTVTISLASGPI